MPLKKKRKFALVCYAFPPSGMGFAQRVGKLCKYLPQVSDWHPHVFCGENIREIFGEDKELAEEIPDDITITRVPSFESRYMRSFSWWKMAGNFFFQVRKLYSFPDYRVDWARNLTRAAVLQYPDKESFEAVFASGPPRSSYVAGYWLARYWKIPLIIDLRDPWNPGYVSRGYTPLHTLINEWWERRIYRFSSKIIANTLKNKETLLRDYPGLAGKVVTIPNGYDPDDIDPQRGPALKGVSENAINLLYLGGLRGSVPKNGIFEEPFLRIVSENINKYSGLKHRVRLHFVGSDGRSILDLIRKLNLEEICFFYRPVSSKEIGRPLAETDACVVIVNSNAEGSGWIPSKVYDYLASSKPILAISPQCGLTDLLAKYSNCYEVIDPHAQSGTEQFKTFVDKLCGKSFQACSNNVSGFSRRDIARQIVDLLCSVGKER